MKKIFTKLLILLILFSFIFPQNITYAETVSVALSDSEVTITNNVGKRDTIYVTGVMGGDTIRVYNAATGGKVIGKAAVSSQKTEATITISQLGTNSGSVYVSVTSKGMTESSRTKIDYDAELISDAPLLENITITNNSGKVDTVYVCGLAQGDVVKLYTSDNIKGKLLGSATVGGNKTEVTISISQLGSKGGSIYASVTSKGMKESERIEVDFSYEGQSEFVKPKNITITNNSGKADTIYISGLASGDKVKVYDTATGNKLIGSSTVSSNKTETTLTISQLGIYAGSVYISNTSPQMAESGRVTVSFSGENQVESISVSNVKISNNSGKADTIYVTGLTEGDKISIYTASSAGRLLGSATASSDGSATVSIGQLGISAGSVYISATSSGMLESSRVGVSYAAESQTDILDGENITVTNNAGKADTIYVSGLVEGNTIKVYNASTGGTLLGSATVKEGAADVTIEITQLGTSAGTTYVSLTDDNQMESDRIAVNYSEQGKSSIVDEGNVVVTNNSGKADTVYVSDLTAGDVVKVYDSAVGSNLLGTATVGDSNTDATLSITQLGVYEGSVYVSITGDGKSESSRIKINYLDESKSKTLDVNNITVTNNVGADDTVQAAGVSSNEVIKVYDAQKGGNLLGSSTVASGSTSTTVVISQLSTEAGSIYVSVADVNKLESDRVKVDYSEEAKSAEISDANISITNRSGSADTIDITGLSQNDIIKVYDLAKGGNLLGSSTVATGDTKVTISITQLGTSLGSVYISRTITNKAESDRVKTDYLAEPKSSTPKAENIIVINNAGIDDTVQVKGLSVNDVVDVYDSAQGGSLLGSATVANYATEATAAIPQLGTDAGNIYISVTSTNKGESDRMQVGFSAESKSDAPDAGKVSIVNNAGISGTVKVAGLSGGDIVDVYDSEKSGTLLGLGTVGTYDTDVTISVTQLGSDAGSVFISVTSKGKLESGRTEVAYSAKLVSSAPNASNIAIENNSGISDTIELVGLQPNDVVKVYDSNQNVNLLGTATASADNMRATVTISQLGISEGEVYVSVTTLGKTESSRTKVEYNAESQSDPLAEGDISVENNAGTSDVIDVTGVSDSDVVNVYSASIGGTTLGTATVTSGNSEIIINISQLGTNAGSIYVSATRVGKTESNRTKIDYSAESTAPVEGNISIVNNAVISDAVTVKGLIANDIVKVYDAAQNGNLLGYAIVSANSQEAEVTISQLTINAGRVYVSVTNFGKGESRRTKADYLSEQTSAALYSGNVSIANNTSGTSDIITVSNLSVNDVIKVYDASNSGNLIGTATVSFNGDQAIITIPQLSSAAGNVYITVTNIGKNESSRTKIGYVAEK